MKLYEDKVYIKMCEKSWEIQELSPRERHTTDLYSMGSYVGTYDQYRPEESRYEAIWLPTQEDLQGMVSKYDDGTIRYNAYMLTRDASIWIWEIGAGKYDSMNQLWLAFVMKELYNKVWNGEEWVK